MDIRSESPTPRSSHLLVTARLLNVDQVGLAFYSPTPPPDAPVTDVLLMQTRGTQQIVRT